ncbi:MAG: hypothetical protein HKN18_10830 [Silicimonas sp.]|nr:hypothetical protein [Silicimonas sp.]
MAYHKVIGFTDIVVVSNDCDDGSDDLLDRLHGAREVTHIRQDVPHGMAPQKNAERQARRAGVFRNGDWVMWLDLDEFLFVQPGAHRIDDLIDAIRPAQGIAIAWRHFGDAGVMHWPGRQLSDHFVLAEKRNRGRPRQIKTLFRWSDEIEALDIHRPIFVQGTNFDTFPMVGSHGKPVSEKFYDMTRRAPHNWLDDTDRVYRLGQVFHFAARTPDLYHEKKVARGRGYAAQNKPNARHSIESRPNFNQVEERSGLAFVPAVTAEMKRLYDLPDVKAACDAIPWFKFDHAARE